MSISIEKSSIWKDITKIISSPSNFPYVEYDARIHTALEDYNSIAVMNIDTVRDYYKNIGDHINISFKLSFGDYVVRFYPFKDNLELTLTLSFKGSVNSIVKAPTPIRQRFKMVFLPNENPHVDVTEYRSMDKNTLDHLDMITVKVQLLDRSLEPLRIKMTQGVFSNIKPETFLRAVIGSECNNILVDGKPSVDAIDLYQPDNTEIQNHIIVPTGTHVLSLPTFVQERMNGVYSGGIGTYLQTYKNKKTLFIYPMFNTNRYVKDASNVGKAIFFYMPKYRYQGIDNTYTTDGNLVKIVCSSDKSYQDDGETSYMNSGVGFAQADARSFMTKPIIMGANGPEGSPAQISTYVANKARDDGLNYAPNSPNGISSNPFLQYSEVSKRNVSRIDLIWEHSDPSLIYPGMPCQFVFLEDNVRTTVNGIIAFSQTYTVKANSGITTNIMIRNTMITILAARRPKITTAHKSSSVQLNT